MGLRTVCCIKRISRLTKQEVTFQGFDWISAPQKVHPKQIKFTQKITNATILLQRYRPRLIYEYISTNMWTRSTFVSRAYQNMKNMIQGVFFNLPSRYLFNTQNFWSSSLCRLLLLVSSIK